MRAWTPFLLRGGLVMTVVLAVLFITMNLTSDWDQFTIFEYITGLPSGPYNEDSPPVLLTACSLSSKEAYGHDKVNVMSEICLENKRIFSELHGIPFVLGRDTPQTLKLGLSPRLLKVYWILKLLRRGVRRIIYTDLDTVFTSRSNEIINTLCTMNASIGLSPDWRKPSSSKRRIKKYKFAVDSGERSYDGSKNVRLNTGVLLIKNSPVILELFETIFREGLLHPQTDVSDQKLLNKHIWRMVDASEIALINRVQFNAFPIVTDSRYRGMGLPVGDETGNSLLVHFAGVFGGSSSEDGKSDPLTLLLVFRELVQRQKTFLLDKSGHSSSTNKIDACLVDISKCIDSVFQDLNIDRAEENARGCLLNKKCT